MPGMSERAIGSTTGSELVASEVELLVLVASVTVGVVEAVGLLGVDEEFALSRFPEFVRSGDGFCAAAPLKLDAEELTVIGVVRAAAPRRAASWVLVTQTGLGSFAPSAAMRSWKAVRRRQGAGRRSRAVCSKS